jgi:TonB family protein
MIAGILLAAAFAAQTTATPPGACDPSTGTHTILDTEFCLGNEALRRGEAAPKESAQRTQLFEAAADHYRRAAGRANTPAEKSRALDLLAVAFDAKHLGDAGREEAALRELIATAPTECPPLFRLADLQERSGQIEAAEDTLVGARRRDPDALEPYKQLAQFYARRVAAMQTPVKEAMESPRSATRDEAGNFRVGGTIQPPRRLDRPVYPADAQNAGVSGVVVVDILIDGTGTVTDARVVRSIPLLDASAIEAVHNWHFQPTLVNGQAVPVRMNVSVAFSLSQ